MPMPGSLGTTLLVLSLPLTVGCSHPVTPEPLSGSYVASTFTLSGNVTEDVLALGGSLTITFEADGITSGSLFLPAGSSASGGMDFTADMAGTFVIGTNSFTLIQAADTFVRDLMWTWDQGLLRGTGTFSGVTITVVLSPLISCCI